MRLYKSDSLDKTACDLGGEMFVRSAIIEHLLKGPPRREIFMQVLFTVVFSDNTRFCYMLILAR